MYCIKCGVELADSEAVCPLCHTRVYHPDLERTPAPKSYPVNAKPLLPDERKKRHAILTVLTVLFLVPFLICFLIDIKANGKLEWSDYVGLSMALYYVAVIFPFWFKNRNPVIFLPIDFIAAGGVALYINCKTGGHWFLSFAFPVLGGIMLITVATVALCRYLKKGHLFIFAGTFISLGCFMLLVEFLMNYTFSIPGVFVWALYPLAALCDIGVLLLIVAICRPIREALQKLLFF